MVAAKKAAGGSSKAAGKKKAPAYDTSPAALAEFGVKLGEIVRTPLGAKVTVIGVKHDAPKSNKGSVWVRFGNGHEAPLEAGQSNAAAALGFKRCSEADQIRASVAQSEAALQKLEGHRQVVVEVMSLLRDGQPLPPHLLPPPKEKEKDAKKGGAGKTKA